MPRDERISGVDLYLAQRWFKTVTKQTFDTNNYRAPQYARDSMRAVELWKKSSAVPLPVMIRYLCEYSAMEPENMAATLVKDLRDRARPASVPPCSSRVASSWAAVPAGR